jgi:hypothetical protein
MTSISVIYLRSQFNNIPLAVSNCPRSYFSLGHGVLLSLELNFDFAVARSRTWYTLALLILIFLAINFGWVNMNAVTLRASKPLGNI